MDDRRLGVYFEGREAGILEGAESGRMTFRYSRQWLDAPDAFALSRSLPLQEEAFAPERAHRFFANLLPEGSLKERLARQLGLSPENDFGLLGRVGGECAGALWIGLDEPSETRCDYLRIHPKEIVSLLRGPGVFPVLAGRRGARLSLAGAQDKLPVLFRDGEILLPLHGAPSTHLLKFPGREFRGLPENEALITDLAVRCGLPAVETVLIPVGSIKACLVTRYDRRRDAVGNILRVHQEDFCQAMGLSHAMKYEEDGGPGFAAAYTVLTESSDEPARDGESLLRWHVFNILAGNADGHGKNLSLIRNLGSVRLAPFYDLVCTRAYRGLSRSMAMGTGGQRDPGRITGRDLETLANDCGINPRWFVRFAEDTAERFLTALEEAPPGEGSPFTRSLLRLLSQHALKVRNAFQQRG